MKTTRPESEAPVPAGWFGDLHDDIRSMIAVGDGKTVFVDHLPTGQVIRVKLPPAVSGGGVSGGAAAPASPICAIVTGGNDLVGYSVQLYPNGYDQPGIGVGTAFLLQGNPQLQTIPIGTKIMVYPYGGMLETLG